MTQDKELDAIGVADALSRVADRLTRLAGSLNGRDLNDPRAAIIYALAQGVRAQVAPIQRMGVERETSDE